MSKSVCSKAPVFRETGRLLGHPRRAEKPVIGTSALSAQRAAQRRYKCSSETEHQLGTQWSLGMNQAPLKTTDGKRGVGRQVKWWDLPTLYSPIPCLTASSEELKTGCLFLNIILFRVWRFQDNTWMPSRHMAFLTINFYALLAFQFCIEQASTTLNNGLHIYMFIPLYKYITESYEIQKTTQGTAL